MIIKLVNFFTSLRLTVACLSLAMLLVFIGTLAQVDEGLYAAQNRYFRSFLIYWTPGGATWGISTRYGSPVYGWVPLGWGDPFEPWWHGCSARCWSRYNEPFAVNGTSRPLALKCEMCTGRPARLPMSSASRTDFSKSSPSPRMWLA